MLNHPYYRSPKAQQADDAREERDEFIRKVSEQLAKRRTGRILLPVTSSDIVSMARA